MASKAQLVLLQAMFLDQIYKQFMRDQKGRVTNILLPKTCPNFNQNQS